MVSIVVGGLFVALGLFAGGALVAAPLANAFTSSSAASASFATGPALWLLFPLFFAVGYALVIAGTRSRHAIRASFVLTSLLLLLGLASAVALVLAATALIHPVASTWSLWFVLIVAGVAGCIGTAAGGGPRAVPA